mmetsp:Transcript_58735/g.128575  ORF Transcript_58735/g.128575 Transcript_58735/m.128575 type:complete len:270 (+) Transcript_58735:775-1584(+)
MDSLRACFTVEAIEVNRPVVLPTRDLRTDSDNLSATSAATFLVISSVLNFFKMGSKSSSVRTAPPVMFLTPLVSDLKSPPTRPSSFFSSSASEPEESDSTSASKSSSSPDPRNSACLAARSASSGLFFEKSSSCMRLLDTLPPSQWRASLPFLGLEASASFSFELPSFFPLAFVSLARASATLAASSSSSSSSLSPSAPPLFPFLAGAGKPFSSRFFCTSAPFFVSAKERMPPGLRDSLSSLSAFCRQRRKSWSKSTCLMVSPLPKLAM